MDVQAYWNAIAAKANDPRQWHQLERQLQDVVISSLNQLIFVLGTNPNQQGSTNAN